MVGSTRGLLERTADLQTSLKGAAESFPFKTELSLVPLLNFFAKKYIDESSAKGVFIRTIRDQVEQVPELLAPITDLSVIERHRALVEVLMGGVFPPVFFDQEYSAVLIPFALKSFYATPLFEQHLQTPDGALRGRVNLGPEMINAMRLFFAYALVLDRIYGIKLDVDYPLILTTTDPDTGLERHLRWISTGASSRWKRSARCRC